MTLVVSVGGHPGNADTSPKGSAGTRRLTSRHMNLLDPQDLNTQDPDLNAQDQALLRRAIEISVRSVTNGNLPFGALLADRDGKILLESENTDITGKSPLNHAETNLMRMAIKALNPEQIATATFFTSCEPCAMCSGAMYWGGINRMIYAISEHALAEYTGASPLNPTMKGIGCRSILNSGQRRVEVSGPHLIEEASMIHRDFWAS